MADGPTPVDFRPDDAKALSALAGLLSRNIDDLVVITKITAEIRRAYFDGLVAQGFPADQALFLCAQGGTPIDYLFQVKK